MRVLFIAQQIDYEPQGIMSLSSSLKAAGHEVELAVGAYRDVLPMARAFRPGILAYSVITGSQRYYLEMNLKLKAALQAEGLKVFSVFGGPHPTFFPEMIEEEGVDGICIGEGEEAFVELADALVNGFHPAILNWHFKLEGEIIHNPVRPYIHDLDSLPLPDRALIYSRDRTSNRSKIKHFIAGRGCPYNCTYCFNHALSEIYRGKGKRFRQRSVDNVLEEVSWVKERYPLEFVVFVDDTFVLNLEWLEEFAEKYPRRIGLPFFCNTRPNLVTSEQVRLLKKAGCHSVSMGFEAGPDRLRNELLRRNISREQIVEAARLLREGGIHFTSTNMLGLPTSTLEDDFETLELNIECRPAYAHAFIFQPYPRTQLGEFTREHGWMVGTFDDLGEVAWDKSVLNFSPRHKRRLTNLQRFFAIVVEWPWLWPLVRHLLPLPNNPLFWMLNKLWKGYAIKKRVHPIRLSLSEYIEIAWHFMKIHS